MLIVLVTAAYLLTHRAADFRIAGSAPEPTPGGPRMP
jgi:hypothetical protein